jgi:hypothetical protein
MIETLDVGVSGWCVRDPNKVPVREAPVIDTVRTGFRWRPKPRPRRFILIEPSPGGLLDGASLLAIALIGNTADRRITHEVLIHADGAEASKVDKLQQYVDERSYEEIIAGDRQRVSRRVWKKDKVKVSLIPLSRFQRVFRSYAYKYPAFVIGYDLPRALSRVATRWEEVKRGRYCKGWSFEMLAPGGKEEANSRHRRNRVRVKAASRGATFMDLDGWGKAEGAQATGNDAAGDTTEMPVWHRGQFLCLRRLAYALSSDRHLTRESALATFTGEIFEAPAPALQESIAIDYFRAAARATLSLAGALVGLFDMLPQSRARFGGSFPETRAQSPASVAGALAREVGLGAPGVRQDRLGSAMEALHGGWVETAFRGFLPVSSLDYSKQYATIATLVGLQNFLAVERLDFIEATQEARELAAALTLVDILRYELWPRLAILCWVRCEGQIVPIKAPFDGKQFSMGMVHHYSDRDLVPLWLPDVIAAKLLSGSAPDIVHAERIVPGGDRRRLRKVRLPSGAWLHPNARDVFLTLIEEGERLRRGDGHWRKVLGPTRQALYGAWKAGNNGLAFGLLAQTNEVDLPGELREEVTLLFDGGSIRAPLLHPSDPGAFACVPLAGLVTSCARLLQACVHRAVNDRGGLVAMGDTDSSHIVSTETGGRIPVETVFSDPNTGGARTRTDYIHALSEREVEEIAALFEPLNPFDKRLMPGSPLKIKSRNVEALIIADKCYCLLGADGILADGKASILGMYMPPVENWITEAWRYIIDLWRRASPRAVAPQGGSQTAFKQPRSCERPWLDRPAVRTMPASASAVWGRVKSVAPRPFDLFLAARAVGRKSTEPNKKIAVVLAPFETDPEKWCALPWVFEASGELVPFKEPDAEGWRWELVTIADVLQEYVNRHPDDVLDAEGSPCRWYARGPLRRRSVRRGRKWVLTKESLTWSDDPALAFWTQPPEAFRADGGADPGISRVKWETIRAAIAVVGPTQVTTRMGLTSRSASYWAAGKSPSDPDKVAQAVVAVATKAGFLLPDDNGLSSEAICAELPWRGAAAQFFVSAMVALIADRLGGLRELARTMAIDEKTARRWLALCQGELRPVGKINAIVAKLGKLARREIGTARRRMALDHGPAGERQAIVAYLSVLDGAEKPIILSSADTLALPLTFLLVALFLAVLVGAFADSTRRRLTKEAERKDSSWGEARFAEAAE